MSGEIDSRNINRSQPPQPPEPQPSPTPSQTRPQPPVAVDDGAARIAQLQQDGEWRREQIFATYAGTTAGAVTAQQPFIADARAQQVYQQAYGSALKEFRTFHRDHIQPLAESLKRAEMNAGTQDAANKPVSAYYAEAVKQLKAQPQFRDVPMSMIDVANQAGAAYRLELSRFDFTTGDVPRMNPLRAADFLRDYAGDGSDLMTRLSPRALEQRIADNVPPDDYLVRLLGEPYTHTPDAVLSRSPRAWASPMDEALGYRLNSSELFGAFGLTSSTPPEAQRMAVLNGSDYVVAPATWDEMISTAQREAARPGSDFKPFASASQRFWESVKSYDYGAALDQMNASGLKPNRYAAMLDARGTGEGDVFRARYAMDDKLGVNRNFRGDGIVTYPQPDSTPGAREFGIGERPIRLADPTLNGSYPEIAFVDLIATGADPARTPNAVAVETTPRVPLAPNTIRAETRNGALAGAATGFFFSGGRAINDVLNGRRDAGEALFDVAGQTAFGAGAGAGSAVLENYSTRAINQMMGGASRTAAGQLGRQALGSGVAGGLINTGFALYDNYQAYENGEITGAQYTGRVAGEAAVGVAAGVAGAYAGAAIGSFIPIPVVGTLAGAAVGFAAGMAVDYLSRELGLDTAVANLTEGAVELGSAVVNQVSETASTVVSNVGEAASDFAEGARNTINDLAGGAVNTLASVFG